MGSEKIWSRQKKLKNTAVNGENDHSRFLSTAAQYIVIDDPKILEKLIKMIC